MDSRLMIDEVVRQTTLRIAALATSTGIRAPLAHLADQVFLDLAEEIERQGVSKKVAADMFGLALRSYQRKVGRLRESATVPEQTLWQAVLEFITSHGDAVSRSQVLERFARDEEPAVVAVLGDLVSGGLLYATGRGKHAVYGATTRGDQEALLREHTRDGLLHVVWLEVAAPEGASHASLCDRFAVPAERVEEALSSLAADGRVREEEVNGEKHFFAARLWIPAGSEVGWETAVVDHFRAVCTALIRKLAQGGSTKASDPWIGGSTLSFELHADHPLGDEVRGLLARIRGDVQGLWERVSQHNQTHPPLPEQVERVIFYVGQNHVPPEAE